MSALARCGDVGVFKCVWLFTLADKCLLTFVADIFFDGRPITASI